METTPTPAPATRALLLAAALLAWTACEPTPPPQGEPWRRAPLPETPGTGAHYAPSAWPTLHRDARNSDYVPLSPGSDVEVAWTALEGAAIFVGPTLGPEGRIYVPSGRGPGHSHLHAFDAEGRLLWEAEAMESLADLDHGAVISAPIVDADGHVYQSDLDQLRSYTARGRLRWVTELRPLGIEGFFVTPVFTKEGRVAGISTDGRLALFERDTGEPAAPVLELPGGPGPPGQPAPPGLLAGGLLAEDFIRPLWDLMFGRGIEVANTPAVHPDTGRIYITAAGATPREGVLYGIDTGPDGARIAFATPMGAGSGTSPTISPDGRHVHAIDDDGRMVAVDADTGAVAWEASGTMGAASPSVGADGTIYSFDGVAGTVVAIDGTDGSVRWRRQYDEVARRFLRWHPLADRVTTVDGILTVTLDAVWAFLDLGYAIGEGEERYPQPRRVIVARLRPEDGELVGWMPSRDTSGALAIPDAEGRWYLSLSGAASSIAWHGVNPRLPFFLRTDLRPTGGIVALRPRRPQAGRAEEDPP